MGVGFIVGINVEGSISDGGGELTDWCGISESGSFSVIHGIGGGVLEVGSRGYSGCKPKHAHYI